MITLAESARAVALAARHQHKTFVESSARRNIAWLFSTNFQAQSVKLRQLLEENRGSKVDFESAWDEVVRYKSLEFVTALGAILASTMRQGSAATAADLRVAMPMIDNVWPLEQAHTVFVQTNKTSHDTIKSVMKARKLVEAFPTVDFPLSMDPTEWDGAMQDIQSQFNDFLSGRANTVARDQASLAYERGGYAVVADLQKNGQTYEKAWDGDADACESTCQPNIDADYISFDDTFPSGDDTAPSHPNCGCTTVYQLVTAEA